MLRPAVIYDDTKLVFLSDGTVDSSGRWHILEVGLFFNRFVFRPGLTSTVAVFFVAVLLAGCGSTDFADRDLDDSPSTKSQARLSSETTIIGPTDSSRSDSRATGETAFAAADEAATPRRLRQGIESVDPNAAGTVVAHAVTDTVVAYRSPGDRSEVIESFDHPTERGGPLVFQVVDQTSDGWLKVALPVRPNGTTGWVRSEQVDLTLNPYRIEIDASSYTLRIYRYGTEQLSTTVAIGTGDTPTPIGDFYLIELLKPSDPDGAYGPYAYGLSGYSDTLESFNGGEGVIGIHGTNQPELLGTDVSHGCIRVANSTITEMTQFLPLGTPVSIFRSA